MDGSTKTPEDETDPSERSASDVEAYESEWYEVLKRRAEELADDDADGQDDDADDGP